MAVKKIDLSGTGKRITNVEEALEASGLNFITEQSELMGATNGLFAPKHKMLYRPDTNEVLGIVGNGYHPIQNSTAMAFMDAIVQKNNFAYTSAVSQDGGAVTVVTAQSAIPDTIRRGDDVCREIKLINGFNGKVGFSVEFSVLRVVCTNGLVSSERESIMRFKHTIKVQDRMAVALRVFDQSVEFHDKFIQQSRILAEKAVDHLMVEKFINGLYTEAKQNDKKKEMIRDLAVTGKGNNGNTLWDLYNGVTEFVDHHYGKEESRAEFALFGAGHKLKEEAWDLALSMA